jgi:hypothetical protein
MNRNAYGAALRFLLYGSFSDDVSAQFLEAGHKVTLPIEAGIALDSPAAEVLEAARRGQYELVVADRTMLNALLPTAGRRDVFGRVLVFLNAGNSDAALAVVRLFDRYKRLTPGRLYTVSPQRVKVSQLPSSTL